MNGTLKCQGQDVSHTRLSLQKNHHSVVLFPRWQLLGHRRGERSQFLFPLFLFCFRSNSSLPVKLIFSSFLSCGFYFCSHQADATLASELSIIS